MEALGGILFGLGMQGLVGATGLTIVAAARSRARRVTRARFGRGAQSARGLAAWAALALVAGVLLGGPWWTARPSGLDVRTWLLIAVGSAGTAGAHLLVLPAVLHERHGRWRAARALARLGGLSVALGAALTLLVELVDSLGQGRTWTGAGWTAAVLLGVAGGAGLLAGLSGKPRPVGGASAVAWLVAASILLSGGS